jgi:hypothetical protein
MLVAVMEHWLGEVLLRDLKVGWEWLLMSRYRKTARYVNGSSRLMANLKLTPAVSGASTSSIHAAVPPILDGIVASSA